jgi:hypothetical protein
MDMPVRKIGLRMRSASNQHPSDGRAADQRDELPPFPVVHVASSSQVGATNNDHRSRGQNEKPPVSGLCQLLPPAADMALPMLPPPCADILEKVFLHS